MYDLFELALWGRRSNTYKRLRSWWREEHKGKAKAIAVLPDGRQVVLAKFATEREAHAFVNKVYLASTG